MYDHTYNRIISNAVVTDVIVVSIESLITYVGLCNKSLCYIICDYKVNNGIKKATRRCQATKLEFNGCYSMVSESITSTLPCELQN